VARAQQLEASVAAFKREVERAEKARVELETQGKARDVKLTRALQDAERSKDRLASAREGERGATTASRSEAAKLAAENKRLIQQRNELLLAFKKQFRLVDVLKKQIVHLEAARTLQFTEEEFTKALRADK